jgi:hypothetical protein
MNINDITKKIIPIIKGFEKDPGDELVISIEVRNTSLAILQQLFKDTLLGGELPIKKKHVKELYATMGLLLDTTKLDYFIGLYADNEEGQSLEIDGWAIPPKKFAKNSPFADLVPAKPRTSA